MNFIYFSTLAWDEADGAHNPTQIARALAQRGHMALFVEPQPSASRDSVNLPLRVVALTELGMSPMQLRRAWYGLDSGEMNHIAENLLQLICAWDAAPPRVAIFPAPFDPFVRLIPFLRAHNFSMVYYAMDDFAAAPALGYTQFATGAEEYLVRHSDVLCAVTSHIAQSLERFGKSAHVIPNAVDLKMWDTSSSLKGTSIERGELTLGFWGTLMDSMIDADLIAYVAQARPRWMIHLLGACDPEAHRPSIAARLEKFPNIFFHGAVPHAELPRYAAAFDVAVAPFPDNAFTRGRDPLKVYEYLAAHLPVVVSYAPQLARVPYVFIAHSHTEFLQAVERAAPTPIDDRELDAFLEQQSWDARAEALLDILPTTTRPITSNTSATLLPTFANPNVETVMRYANALESELAQVQNWARALEQQAQQRTAFSEVKRLLPTRKTHS